jgi:hypothetical protein
MQYLVSELFDIIEKQQTKEEKLNTLLQHNNDVVRSILRFNYDYNLVFNVPEGEPPFNKITDRPIGYHQTTLQQEMRRMYIWVNNTDMSISKLKRESLFINMLEGLHYTEAEILCLAKDRKLETRYPSLTYDLVNEAFPGLLPPPLPKPELEVAKPTKKSRTKKSLQESAVM